ncbi:MAG: M42 family metallopeptidase [Clostridiales bacterium]|jgi:putative aminopeptidase FrvX|nr:M42 family metallopeptidase [Clostridiales bacterium]
MKELLVRLTGIYGPSGREEAVRQAIRQEIEGFVDEITEDVMGNLIAVKKSSNPDAKKVMLAAHMDQIGLIVTNIDENGFLRFSNVGGVSPFNVLHRRVVFQNGVTGAVSYETELDDMKKLKLDKMYIDIGARSREEAGKHVQIGDAAVYHAPMAQSGDRYFGCAMDDRAGCAVLVETIRSVKESPNELIFVFTVQEEVGLRGAKTSAYTINPDIGISVDVTLTGDTPKSRPMAVNLGDGPAVKVKDASVICHPKVKDLMIQRAEEAGIPYQLEVLEYGGTDSGAIHLSREGVPSGVISIPCRYVHSAHEMVDRNDLENAVKLLTCILEKEIV